MITVDTILMDAKADKRKGDYRVYSTYKQKLMLVCPPDKFEEACRELANALRV